MNQIKDKRRNIIIHEDVGPEDLPLAEVPDLPSVRGIESFVPKNMDEPKLYTGDVIAGVYDGSLEFVELIYDVIDDGVVVVSLDSGAYRLHGHQHFSSRFYGADEFHVYDNVSDDTSEWDIAFDESKLSAPEPARDR